MTSRRSSATRLPVLAALLATFGCSDNTTGPSSRGLAFPVSLTISASGGGPATAFDRADRLSIRLTRNGSSVLDTVMPFASGGGDVALRLGVDASLDGVALDLAAELRQGTSPLFRGAAAATPSSGGGTPVSVVLDPVVSTIAGPAAAPVLTAIGGTLTLSAAALFATGDTVPGIPITYRLLDAGVVTLQGGVVRAVAEGQARIEASYSGLVTIFQVEVRPAVARIVVAPNRATVLVSGRQAFTATLTDAAGNVLRNRTVAWSSSAPSVATVDGSGLAVGVSAGSADITASAEGVSGIGVLTVTTTPPPSLPTSFAVSVTGTDVTLTWQDNATTETSYEVYRGPAGGARVRIATLPANATTYRDVSLGADQVVDYSVGACAAGVCGETAALVGRTVPVAPTNLVLTVTDSATRAIRLQWQDASVAELVFEIQAFDSTSSTGGFVMRDEVPANSTQYNGTGTPGLLDRYRVLACNAAGCSAPSNVVSVQFALSPPTVITQPSVTGTDFPVFVDGYGAETSIWFEYDSNAQFTSPDTTGAENYGSIGAITTSFVFFDVPPLETVYYRGYAQNAAGTTQGNTVVLTTPDLKLLTPANTTLCNQVSACSNPVSAVVTATATVPIGAPSPYSAVFFEEGMGARLFLGPGTESFVDNAGAGTRTYSYAYTYTPVSYNPGTYFVAAVGDTGPSGGTVFVGYIAFNVTVF